MNRVLLCAALAPQGLLTSQAPTLPAPIDQPAPGERPGTERWIVMFRGAGQDLHPLRLAILRRAQPAETDALIADLAARAASAHPRFLRELEARSGRVLQSWWLIHGCAIEIAPAHLAALAADPDVERLVPDSRRRAGALPIKKSTDS